MIKLTPDPTPLSSETTRKSPFEELALKEVTFTEEKTVVLVSQAEAQAFINNIKEIYKTINEQEIFIGISVIKQKGETAKKAARDIYFIINNK